MARLLDLFCGAGGAAVGYHRAGFTEIVGVDLRPQPRYPFTFIQADALEFLAGVKPGEYDLHHASPPCQHYCRLSRNFGYSDRHPDLVEPVREGLRQIGTPYVIENVPGAPLHNAIILCGSMFGLDVRRHRLFEATSLLLTIRCAHYAQQPRFRSLDRRQKKLSGVVGVHGSLNYAGELELRKQAMGIDWMSNKELTQSIPPAYTEWIGRQLLAAEASHA